MARGNWLGYKGSSQRLGANGFAQAAGEPAPAPRFAIVGRGVAIHLGEPCRSLLAYDRHLIAVAQSGTVEIRDPEIEGATLRLKAEGPITCDPCVDAGILYLGCRGSLSAFSLGGLTLRSPRQAPLWRLPLSGTPIQALTVLGNRLFASVYHDDGRREIQVVENLERTPPPAPRLLHAAARLSWLAADPLGQELVFLSQTGDSSQLHRVGPTSLRAEAGSQPLLRSPRPFSDQVPIALLGGKLFGIFGEDERLCRIDVRRAEFEQSFGADVKMFALDQERERDWDGDGVQVDISGVHFLRSGHSDSFTPLERVVKGSPIIARRRAVVLGMQDGRLRIYDLRALPRYDVLRLSGDAEPITALIAFQSYIAVGNVQGAVEVLELRLGPEAAA